MLSTDNTSVVSIVQAQGGTRSHSLYLETRGLLVLCRNLNISLSAIHIPGRLNALADGLSCKHQLLPSERTLHQEVANQIFLTFDCVLVDLFATRDNNRLPLYVNPVYDAAAWAADALSFAWDQLVAYAYPPPILIPHSRESQCERLPDSPCRPCWPRRPWFNTILGLLYDYHRLPHRLDLLFQWQTSCGPRHVPLTRLAVIRRSMQKKRFSAQASALIVSTRRKSNGAVYDTR